MKKSIYILSMLAALLANPANTSNAQSKLEAVASVDINSGYRFRGMKFSEKGVVQPTININYGSYTGTIFANHDMNLGFVNEYDFILRHDQKITDDISISTSFTYLDLPRTDLVKSREIAIGVNTSYFLNPSLIIAKDIDKGAGEYVGLTINKDSLVSIAGIPINASVAIGYNNHYWSCAKSWSHADISLKTSLPIDDKISITPNITFSRSLNKNYFQNQTITGLNIAMKLD